MWRPHLAKIINLREIDEWMLGPRLSVFWRIGCDGSHADVAFADSGAAFNQA
jgi:hypothetical protein